MSEDRYDTEARRRTILDAWSSSPTRFREDANAEEDLVRLGYADRLLIELAQNASDAATRAGVIGRLRFTLADGCLTAANTGRPLDEAGVDALTSLRASAKRDTDSIGRFGVGFAAVLAVSDEPEVRSVGGGVAFSRRRTIEAVSAAGGPAAEELGRREGAVPVLRLVWPTDVPPPEGFATEVVLPLRDEAAEKAVRAAFAELDASLLLAVPGLSAIDLDGRLLERQDVGAPGKRSSTVMLIDGESRTRWRFASASGDLPAGLTAGQRVEERGRTRWRALAAVPVTSAGEPLPLPVPERFHAPTATDERTGIGMRLSATFELSTDRRRIVDSPVSTFLAERLAGLAADVVTACADSPAALAPLPRPGLPESTVDATVRAALMDALRGASWLPERRHAPEEDQLPVSTGDDLSPDRAIVVDDQLVDVLAEVVDGVLPAHWWTPATAGILRELGVRRWSLAEVVDALAGVEKSPGWWRAVYVGVAAVLAADPTADTDAPAALRVPLADGRTVTGARDTLLPTEAIPTTSLTGRPLAGAVADLGLRIIHPDAAHPLLERYGARSASAETVLEDPRVRAAVEDSVEAAEGSPSLELGYEEDADEDQATAHLDAVLTLVAAAGVRAAEPDWAWLAELAMPDADGDWRPAGELLLPGGGLAGVVAADAPFGLVADELVETYGVATLAAVGVLDGFALLDESEVDLVDLSHDVTHTGLDGVEDWAAEVLDNQPDHGDELERSPVIGRFRAVRDLELVAADAWPEALRLLAREPARSVLLADCYLVDSREPVQPYARWWLAQRPILAGRRPDDLRLSAAAELAGLYDPADSELDDGLLAAIGVRAGLVDILADPAAAMDLLARLADPARTVSSLVLPLLYARLAEALAGFDVEAPTHLRVGPTVVVPAEEAVVLDVPWQLDHLSGRHPILGGADPESVAELLDIPLLSELAAE